MPKSPVTIARNTPAVDSNLIADGRRDMQTVLARRLLGA
jgi:hypothetical protein